MKKKLQKYSNKLSRSGMGNPTSHSNRKELRNMGVPNNMMDLNLFPSILNKTKRKK